MQLTESARAALDVATDEARRRRQQVGTPHLLLGLLADPEGQPAAVLRSMGLAVADVRAEARRKLGRPTGRFRRFRPPFSARLELTLLTAADEAADRGQPLDSGALLLALMTDTGGHAAQVVARVRQRSQSHQSA